MRRIRKAHRWELSFYNPELEKGDIISVIAPTRERAIEKGKGTLKAKGIAKPAISSVKLIEENYGEKSMKKGLITSVIQKLKKSLPVKDPSWIGNPPSPDPEYEAAYKDILSSATRGKRYTGSDILKMAREEIGKYLTNLNPKRNWENFDIFNPKEPTYLDILSSLFGEREDPYNRLAFNVGEQKHYIPEDIEEAMNEYKLYDDSDLKKILSRIYDSEDINALGAYLSDVATNPEDFGYTVPFRVKKGCSPKKKENPNPHASPDAKMVRFLVEGYGRKGGPYKNKKKYERKEKYKKPIEKE